MPKRILRLVENCHDCPRRSYYSGGVYECAEVDVKLPYNHARGFIADWCPLARFPEPAPAAQVASAPPAWRAEATVRRVGWIEDAEGKRFEATLVFSAPPDIPLAVAWGGSVVITPGPSGDISDAAS